MKKQTLGIIGLGHLGKAILQGFRISGLNSSSEFLGYHFNQNRAEQLHQELNIKVYSQLKEFIEKCDVIFIVVKPENIKDLIFQLNKLNLKDKILISFVPNIKIKDWELKFNQLIKLAIAMPNINCEFGVSVTGVVFSKNISSNDKKNIFQLLNSFGKTYDISEELFDVFTVIGGSSPAFVFQFIESLKKTAMNNGFEEKLALEIIKQVVYGSVITLIQKKLSPQFLINSVCTPNGITVEGIQFLLKNGFDDLINQSINKSISKSKGE